MAGSNYCMFKGALLRAEDSGVGEEKGDFFVLC